MTATPVQPVILCGGSGTRLWPLSRAGFPKQFLCLTGNESLFQQAARRLASIGNRGMSVAAPYVVSNEEHRFLAQEQLREAGIEDASFLLEPVGRNTAPALTLACLAARQNGEDPILVVTPADQTIADEPAFQAAMRQAVAVAAEGGVVILGITPNRPDTGYGYIRVADSACGDMVVASVERFVEKPDLETARQYLAQGGYFWNAGMFVLRASVWLNALNAFRPDIAKAVELAWAGKTQDGVFIRPAKDVFASVPSESVDYAVMEKCPGSALPIKMIPLAAGWNDLGAWDAVWSVLPKDEAGNASLGDVLASDCRNTLVRATSRLVSLVGVEDLVVIETPDAVLVADKSRSQDVKRIVDMLSQRVRSERNLHRKVHRPWGWYDSIDEDGRFKVKRIQVKPKASLSLQKHHHRAEHWIVVKGTAEVTNGTQTMLLSENQSTYIPLGEVHRLANPGTIPLEIIEVQSGSYLGEDDIVRFEDTYGRQ
ncbi:MAG: mannose-1-phosphate guanylyltransferase/mannose-6-phosphate isomerase [Rhodocyclaceae bacterium]